MAAGLPGDGLVLWFRPGSCTTRVARLPRLSTSVAEPSSVDPYSSPKRGIVASVPMPSLLHPPTLARAPLPCCSCGRP
eukprot:scaffold227229_cov23-Tisochrysis_lutea.AAC.4